MVRRSIFDFHTKSKAREDSSHEIYTTIGLMKMLRSSEMINHDNDDWKVIFRSRNRFIVYETLSTRKFLFRWWTKTVKVCHLFWSFNRSQKNYCLIKENSSWNKIWCFFYELEIKHQRWWCKTVTSPRPLNCQTHKWRQCWFVSWLQLVWIILCAYAMRCKCEDSKALMSIWEIQSQKKNWANTWTQVLWSLHMSPVLILHDVNNMVNFKVLGPYLFAFLPNQSAASGFTSYLVQPDPTIHPFNPTLAKAINFIIFLKDCSLNPLWINPTIVFSLIFLNIWRKKIIRLSKINVTNGYIWG